MIAKTQIINCLVDFGLYDSFFGYAFTNGAVANITAVLPDGRHPRTQHRLQRAGCLHVFFISPIWFDTPATPVRYVGRLGIVIGFLPIAAQYLKPHTSDRPYHVAFGLPDKASKAYFSPPPWPPRYGR